MKKQNFEINGIPSIIWGESSDQLYLFVHGQSGSKEAARPFAEIAVQKGWQVLSLDLPEHGDRVNDKETLTPWQVVPELQQVLKYAKQNWERIALRADSIGVYFSMLSFEGEKLEKGLFLSPILNMDRVIHNAMCRAGVSEEELERRKTIETTFGITLSWEYLCYVMEHPITNWDVPTSILYAGKDDLTERCIVDEFVENFHCSLTVMEDGEHWFHTPQQLEVLSRWTKDNI